MKRLAAAGLIGAALACISLDPVLFAPTRVSEYSFPQDDAVSTRELVQLTSEDGVRLWALWLPRAPGPQLHRASSILYCHGNGDNLDVYYWRVKQLRDLGFNVLMFDYRGYGASEGTPSEQGLYADARAALAELRRRDPTGPYVYYGWSLGSAVCTQLALEQPPQVLHLDSPFPSVERLVNDNSDLPLASSTVSHWRFDNLSKIGKIAAPVQIFHGDADHTLQVDYGKDLYQLAQDPKQLWIIPGAGHEAIPGTPGFSDCLVRFLDDPASAPACP